VVRGVGVSDQTGNAVNGFVMRADLSEFWSWCKIPRLFSRDFKPRLVHL
jgi:hypothetical protein